MSGRLTYRLVEAADLPGLQRLWDEESDWGALTAGMWKRYVLDGPFGGVSGAVATDADTGRIVGQFAFMPALVSVNGRVVRAYRPAAPIVARSERGLFRSPNPMHHPAIAMYSQAVEGLRRRGDGLLYMVPSPNWVRLMRMFPGLHFGKFPLWSLPLPLPAPLPLGEYTAEPLMTWDDRVDRLWHSWADRYSCSVVRDAAALSWKTGFGGYVVLGVYRRGELVGVVASLAKGDRQWLICDILAADTEESLRATLAAASNVAHARATDAAASKPIHKVAVLTTPLMEPAVRALGFARDKYDFPLVIQILDPSIAPADIDPARWYVSAND